MNIPVFGSILQAVFILFITIFNSSRVFIIENYSLYSVAYFELILGVVSFICGVYGVLRRVKPKLSVFVSLFGLLMLFYFVFIYLLPEAGIPPAIPWLFSE